MTWKMKGGLSMASKWYLRVVCEDQSDDAVNPTIAEFKPKDFRAILISEGKITKDIGRAFDRTCDRIRDLTRTM